MTERSANDSADSGPGVVLGKEPRTNVPVAWRPRQDGALLVTGGPGSGKSNALGTIARRALEATAGRLDVWVADPLGTETGWLAGHPNTCWSARGVEGAAHVLAGLLRDARKRSEGIGSPGPDSSPKLCVVEAEELAPGALADLEELARTGPAAGTHVAAFIRLPPAALPESLVGAFPARLELSGNVTDGSVGRALWRPYGDAPARGIRVEHTTVEEVPA